VDEQDGDEHNTKTAEYPARMLHKAGKGFSIFILEFFIYER